MIHNLKWLKNEYFNFVKFKEQCLSESSIWPSLLLTLTTLKYLYINHKDQRVLVNLKSSSTSKLALSASLEYLCYVHYKYLIISARGSLTSIDVIFWCLKLITALKGLTTGYTNANRDTAQISELRVKYQEILIPFHQERTLLTLSEVNSVS